nr:hypothetical protein [Anaerolineae bacterium]
QGVLRAGDHFTRADEMVAGAAREQGGGNMPKASMVSRGWWWCMSSQRTETRRCIGMRWVAPVVGAANLQTYLL